MRRLALLGTLGIATLAGVSLEQGCSDVVHLTLATPAPPVAVVASASLSSITVSWTIDTSASVVPTSFSLYGAIGPWTEWSASLPGAFLSTGLACCTYTTMGL